MTIDNDTLARDYDVLEDQHDILAAMPARIEAANEERLPGRRRGPHPVAAGLGRRGD
jgi:hypothetical protein